MLLRGVRVAVPALVTSGTVSEKTRTMSMSRCIDSRDLPRGKHEVGENEHDGHTCVESTFYGDHCDHSWLGVRQ